MDGAISAAEYHMGRGQGDSATTGTGDSGADTANSSNSTKPRSIASMLAEPEGVSHDLADFGQTTDDDADDAVETTVLETEPAETTTMLETEATKVIPESSFPDAGGPAEPDESGETDESGKTDESGEPHQSYAQMLVKPDYFPREGDENDKPVTGNADGTDTEQHGRTAECERIAQRIARRRRIGTGTGIFIAIAGSAETAASSKPIGPVGVGYGAVHSPTGIQPDLRRQSTSHPWVYRRGRLCDG